MVRSHQEVELYIGNRLLNFGEYDFILDVLDIYAVNTTLLRCNKHTAACMQAKARDDIL